MSNVIRIKCIVVLWFDLRNTTHIMQFAHLANTLLIDEESARDNHVLACNFAKYLLILKTISLTDSAINLS